MGAITEARPVPVLRDAPRPPAPNPRTTRRRTRRTRRGRLLVLVLGAGVAVLVVALVAAAGMVWFRVDRRHVDLVGSTRGTTYLLVGSDSRAFVESAADRAHFGAPAKASGEHADIVLLVRKVGARVSMLDVPRDLVVLAPGDVPTRYALTFSSGLQSLADVTCHSLGVPVDHVAVVHFDGLRRSIDAVGGVDVTFTTPRRDRITGLAVPAGRQRLDGEQALALVRSRTTERQVNGRWEPVPPTATERGERASLVLGALGARSSVSALAPWSSMRKLLAFSDAVTVDDGMGPFQLRDFAHVLQQVDVRQATRLPARFTPGAVPVAVATSRTPPAIRRFTGASPVCSSRFPSLSAGGNS